MYVCMHACMCNAADIVNLIRYVCMYVCMYVSICNAANIVNLIRNACMYIYDTGESATLADMYACVYVCVFHHMHTYIQTHTHTQAHRRREIWIRREATFHWVRRPYHPGSGRRCSLIGNNFGFWEGLSLKWKATETWSFMSEVEGALFFEWKNLCVKWKAYCSLNGNSCLTQISEV